MQEDPKIDRQGSVAGSVSKTGLDRRSLIRAGLASAPVVLGLTSKSAMAGNTHITCSVWSSFKASGTKACLSHGAAIGGGTCKSYNDWKGVSSYPNFCSDYRNSRFHSVSGKYCPPFSGSKYGTNTVRDILNLSGTNAVDKLARHCAALYLSYKESNASCPISDTTCRTIWQNCSAGGTWTPYAGATPWTVDDCNDYFDYVCGISNARNPSGTISVCKVT